MKDDTWLIGRRRSDGAKADQKSIGSVSRMAKGKARCRKATGKNQKPVRVGIGVLLAARLGQRPPKLVALPF